jgi:hypothetical protein
MEADMESFQKKGFLVKASLLTLAETAGLRAAAEAVLAQWEAGEGPAEAQPPPSAQPESHVVRSLTHPAFRAAGEAHHRLLLEVAALPKVLAVARAAFGGAEPMYRATSLFLNPRNHLTSEERDGAAGNSQHTGDGNWHRDAQFHWADEALQRANIEAQASEAEPEPHLGLQLQLPLIPDSSLEYIPGSHRRWDSEEEYGVRLGGPPLDADPCHGGAYQTSALPGAIYTQPSL